MFEGALTDIIVIVATGGLTYLTTTVKRSIKKVDEKVNATNDKVDNLARVVDSHTYIVKDIALCNNVMRKIDTKIKQNFEYISVDDALAHTFLYLQGDIAKTCIEWAIHSNLEVSEDEINGKFESCSFDIRELLIKFEPDFAEIISPKLKCIYRTHVKKAIKIVGDDLVNSKVDRFFDLTIQTTNDVITTFIRERIIFKGNGNKD